jgi:hypothetical protein
MKKKKKPLDACAKAAKAAYKVWPSAYASGAAVQCRKGKGFLAKRNIIKKGVLEMKTKFKCACGTTTRMTGKQAESKKNMTASSKMKKSSKR